MNDHHHHDPNRHIRWDEEVIEEHNKERGTRQKIDEPPTPFSYVNIEDDHDHETEHPGRKEVQQDVSHNWEALNAKLHYEARQQQGRADRAMIGENECDEASKDQKQSQSFAEHRAAHYNEFLVLKAMREKMAMEEEDMGDDA